MVGWLLGASCVAVVNSQYSYQLLGGGQCEVWKNNTHYLGDGAEIVPNQPNSCYLRYARFHLP